MKLHKLVLLASAASVSFPAYAQINSPPASEKEEAAPIVITGSRIKQRPEDSALPLQVLSTEELKREGIGNPEQMIMFLSTNGSGADNLASNSDVVSGAQRGTNGLSAANLRGQGSSSTLVLLNGRRLAAHGLSGSAVDVNQLPFSIVDRVEVLKDGASAIYGTDAVGGVINFITKKKFQGIALQANTDITEAGGGNIYRVGGTAGFGDPQEDRFNIMGAVSYSWNKLLRGNDRSFVNGNQPNRGLSVDTRGTPIASLFNIGANANQTPLGTLLTGLTLTAPNGANAAGGGINILDLPGGAGCSTMDGGMAYDEVLWANPAAVYACAWDTGRAAALQQPIKTLSYYARGLINFTGDHELTVEVTGSRADSAKTFSNAQLSANTTNLPWAYPLNASTTATYNQIYNALVAAFPANAAALAARYGRPLSGRWRCMACGPREYETTTSTLRAAIGMEGPFFFKGWDYKAGASYARSESQSLLGSGYYYRGTLANGAFDPLAPLVAGTTNQRGLVGAINSGLVNPFSVGQTAEGLAALASVSAEGSTLYGGRYEVKQLDYSLSGPLFNVWGGAVQAAFGIDYRRETYGFNGSAAAAATAPVIFLAAFDNVNALTPKNRTVKAAYGEVLVPLFKSLEITGAVRVDDYTGFGSTVNPKVSFKFRPWDPLVFRGSYNTGFRVPGFNQIFNGITESPYAGSDLADPVKCPGGVPTSAFGSGQACAQIRPNIWNGGTPGLNPETAKQMSLGMVILPSRQLTFSLDWWKIDVNDTLQVLTLRQLIDNASLFPDRFIRDAAGNITTIDQRWINAGARRTQGLEASMQGRFDLGGGTLSVGMDGTYLLKKREKLTPTSAFGPSQIGVFTFAGDLGLKWKHNANIGWSNGKFGVSLSQIYRSGYDNQALPGIAAGTVTRPDFNPKVKPYVIYNLTMRAAAWDNLNMTFGVKNLFDKNPPFAITYDGNTGAGSSWEPRVADPRGRAFTMQVEVKF